MSKNITPSMINQIKSWLSHHDIDATDCVINISVTNPSDDGHDQYRASIRFSGPVSLDKVSVVANAHYLNVSEYYDDFVFSSNKTKHPINIMVNKLAMDVEFIAPQIVSILTAINNINRSLDNVTSWKNAKTALKNNGLIVYRGNKQSDPFVFRMETWKGSHFRDFRIINLLTKEQTQVSDFIHDKAFDYPLDRLLTIID